LLQVFLAAQRQNIFLWVPVLLGAGIALYFGLKVEPPFWIASAGLGVCLLAILGFWFRLREISPATLLLTAFSIVLSGWFIAQERTRLVDAPVISKPLDPVTVEGNIASLDGLEEGKGTRVILTHLTIEDLSPEQTPHAIRISIRKDEGLHPGQRIRVLAGLNPPSPPVMPGSFDFQRHMYFLRIGALGFAYKAPEIIGSDSSHMTGWLEEFRQKGARHVESIVPQPEASIVSALLLGEQTSIPDASWQDIRAAGLAHVISISGLHLGMIAGGIFFVTRLLMALIPRLALYHPIKKYAALLAMIGCFFYAVMVGLSVPTLRSVIMTGLALAAIMLDRSPFSMRLVALSALIILLTTPEAMTGPSFQMSFGAVAALIFFFDETRGFWAGQMKRGGILRKGMMYLAGSCATSLIATIATAPFTLYHFQQFPIYSIIGNVLALPVIGLIVMPASVIAYILMPVGLDAVPLWVMGKGITIMLWISHEIASLPYASLNFPAWPRAALFCFVGAGIWLMLLKGPVRWACLVFFAAGCLLVASDRGPDFLVSGSGKLAMARLDGNSVLLSSRRSDKFIAQNWIRAAGVDPETVKTWPKEGVIEEENDNSLSCDYYGCLTRIRGRTIAMSFDPRTIRDDCAAADIVFSSRPAARNVKCSALIDFWDLRKNGTHAIYIGPDSMTIKNVEGERGHRPWTIQGAQ
jgi:competence protein ComEC